MNENEKLRKAFVASAVALVIVGIIFVATMIVSVGQIAKVMVDSGINEEQEETCLCESH